MKIYAGFPNHYDYKTIHITTNEKQVKGFEYLEEEEASPYSFIYWNDESVAIRPFDSLEEMINEVCVFFYDFTGDVGSDYSEETEEFTENGILKAWELLKENVNDNEPDGDSGYGVVVLEGTNVIAGDNFTVNDNIDITMQGLNKALLKSNDVIEESINSNKIYSLDELYPIENWLVEIWEKFDKLESDELIRIFNLIEEKWGKDVSEIIDHIYSADKLHYNQTDRVTITGGTCTKEFIENFEDIKKDVEKEVKESLVKSLTEETDNLYVVEENKNSLITNKDWEILNSDERCNLLLTIIKDPDDCEKYINLEYDNLPSFITSNLFKNKIVSNDELLIETLLTYNDDLIGGKPRIMSDEDQEAIENDDCYSFEYNRNQDLYLVNYRWNIVVRDHESSFVEQESEQIGEGKTIEEAFENTNFEFGKPFTEIKVQYKNSIISDTVVNSKEELIELDKKEREYISLSEFDQILIKEKENIIKKLKDNNKKISDFDSFIKDSEKGIKIISYLTNIKPEKLNPIDLKSYTEYIIEDIKGIIEESSIISDGNLKDIIKTSYVAICKWTEDGEEKWDIIHSTEQGVSYEEADELCNKALKTWKSNNPENYNTSNVRAFPISINKYKDLLNQENQEDDVITEEGEEYNDEDWKKIHALDDKGITRDQYSEKAKPSIEEIDNAYQYYVVEKKDDLLEATQFKKLKQPKFTGFKEVPAYEINKLNKIEDIKGFVVVAEWIDSVGRCQCDIIAGDYNDVILTKKEAEEIEKTALEKWEENLSEYIEIVKVETKIITREEYEQIEEEKKFSYSNSSASLIESRKSVFSKENNTKPVIPIGTIKFINDIKHIRTERGWSPFVNGKFDRSITVSDYDIANKRSERIEKNKQIRKDRVEEKYDNLRYEMDDLERELEDYKRELRQLYIDQEELIPQAIEKGGESEGENVANEIGGEMNDLNSKIEKIKEKIKKLSPKLEKAEENYNEL